MNVYSVLIADDSYFMRTVISGMISEDPRFRVAGTAKNGKEAVEKARQLKPDVITLDIEMPEMNGIAALEAIMKEQPVPILILSSFAREGSQIALQALEAGAFDIVPKPAGPHSIDLTTVKKDLMEKLLLAVESGIGKKYVTANLQKTVSEKDPVKGNLKPPPIRSSTPKPRSDQPVDQIVAIGTSTGGPRALQKVLVPLPASFPAPLLIVQHMPAHFTRSLAERLDSMCEIRVVEGEDGMKVERGTAYIAPGGYHMVLFQSKGSYYISLNQDEPCSGHRPSVDKLFQSLTAFPELKRHAVLMTGMGSDGAKGMRELSESGAVVTIAESEETCIVYGMPRAAVGMNAVTHLLPLYDISSKLIDLVVKG
ncbi:protein-glutamate methylesterase/protein-glutamine glutaminase [Gorillibacterium massiliense]|uniref:protein-glutamate methylesterase/protein-glutamine glutaminase n=1 Tax=Gorillibacterium massiliense TaxID=1280390 RepID=UPI0004AD77E9|nr:chemotaxis response regulator protein-glutamate methylesterase [Gorillibacterium massiliense]